MRAPAVASWKGGRRGRPPVRAPMRSLRARPRVQVAARRLRFCDALPEPPAPVCTQCPACGLRLRPCRRWNAALYMPGLLTPNKWRKSTQARRRARLPAAARWARCTAHAQLDRRLLHRVSPTAGMPTPAARCSGSPSHARTPSWWPPTASWRRALSASATPTCPQCETPRLAVRAVACTRLACRSPAAARAAPRAPCEGQGRARRQGRLAERDAFVPTTTLQHGAARIRRVPEPHVGAAQLHLRSAQGGSGEAEQRERKPSQWGTGQRGSHRGDVGSGEASGLPGTVGRRCSVGNAAVQSQLLPACTPRCTGRRSTRAASRALTVRR